MKAYIVRIEMVGSEPLIWRQVVMPAGASFNRLHDVIQTVTNFLGGYPSDGYHLYEFDLSEENRIVTNDEEAYEDHKHFVKNKDDYIERLRTMTPEMIRFEQARMDRLRMEVRKPRGLKIDDYLEKQGVISYLYDFGDDWRFTVRLEEIVDDYFFGYPTLLDGAETAPPEDVGGLPGFYEFMEIYRDKDHPDHEDAKTWAEALYFKEYDPDWINDKLKSLHYKKTDWSRINHDHYRVIEDKYRKSEKR